MWNIRKHFGDSEKRKIFAGILDESTLMTLYKLSTKGYFDLIHGPIKQGKESTILLAELKGKKIAVKVYAIEAGNFKKMSPYIANDPRFSGIKKDKRSLIFTWCQKEFKNLERARIAGISCPEPIAFSNNVLIMSFLGDDEPYPRLKETKIKTKEVFDIIMEDVKKLFKGAKLVHGDLSEFNILLGDKPYLIDFSQSVLTSHPNAKIFLERDIKNICKYFKEDYQKAYDEVVK